MMVVIKAEKNAVLDIIVVMVRNRPHYIVVSF